jgi:ATP-binding cassette subfamily F protein 3
MEKFQTQLSAVEEKLSDTGLYDAERKAELNQLLQEQGKLKSALEEAEMEWMELTEAMEAAE